MWKKLIVNKNQVKTETGKATLIAFPKNSEFGGMCFWHPSKLIREGSHSANLSLSYTDSFEFKAIKYGEGKFNKFSIVREQEITIEEFEEAFGVLVENSEKESYLEVSEPKPLNIGKIDARKELKK